MLNQPENNIKLSDEQALAIEEAKNRLTNLEAEITIATKNLRGIKLENEKAIKEKIATEELLNNLNVEVAKLTEEKEKLVNTVLEGEMRLDKIAKADLALKEKQAKIAIEQSEREHEIKDKELKLSQQAETLRKEIADLQADKEEVAKFKERLSEVLKR